MNEALWKSQAEDYEREWANCSRTCAKLQGERDALLAIVQELRYALREGYHMSPEGRAYLRKMDTALQEKTKE